MLQILRIVGISLITSLSVNITRDFYYAWKLKKKLKEFNKTTKSLEEQLNIEIQELEDSDYTHLFKTTYKGRLH